MLSAVAPRVASILPATHAMHSPAPASVLYFPTAHAEHVPPFAPEYPVLHMHAVEDTLPVSEIELDGQAAHSLAPSAGEYDPAWHSAHASLLRMDLNVPAAHTPHPPEPDAP